MTSRHFLKTSMSLVAFSLMFVTTQVQPMNPPDMGKMVR